MTLRDESKKNYRPEGVPASKDDINIGSLQRIADACELMAEDHRRLRNERDYYQNAYDARCAWVALLRRRIAALKGVITKLKGKGKVQK